MSSWDLTAKLVQHRARHLHRSVRARLNAQGTTTRYQEQDYVSFCSNNYLGLANHPDLIQALQKGAETFGVGSASSHLINGHSHAHQELEEALADYTERPRALLFSTGYMANLGVLTALLGKQDVVFCDRLNHASIVDAVQLSGATVKRYAHAQVEHLTQRMVDVDYQRALIVSDGLFSMDGDFAPLPELVKVAKTQDAWIMIDDAHGLGVVGENGKGTLSHYGMGIDEVPILMGTFGKAFGSFGAFIAGSDDLIETLVQFARTYIYTTALPPAIAAASHMSLKIVQKESWRRERLQELIDYFRKCAAQLDLPLMPSITPIQPLMVGESENAVMLSQALLDKGIEVTAIRPPSVPRHSARLRITLSVDHTQAQIDRLLSALETLRPHFPTT